ncbi:hypothetical protein Hanom_Chr15g01339801 [Helianthus anomalus]
MDEVNESDENGKIQTFWVQMRKNKPLTKSRKSSQTSGTKKMAFYSNQSRYENHKPEILHWGPQAMSEAEKDRFQQPCPMHPCNARRSHV